MKVVAVDGSIIDVFGPFPATLNDAEILKKIFTKTTIQNIFRPGDVVLVDRGFRDCVKFLQQRNFDVRIPEFLQKGSSGQLTSTKANKSRLITKLRYVIEVANGHVKNKWHLFGKLIPSVLSKDLTSDYKIGSALLNAFSKPIICDKDDYPIIGERMLSLVESKNELKRIIESKAFRKTERFWNTVLPMELEFPRFSHEQLKLLSLGTYALREAISYVAEAKKKQGTFEVQALSNVQVKAHFKKLYPSIFPNPMMIFAEIPSRFINQKNRKVYILYDLLISAEHLKIFAFCTCQQGQRTVGFCSHVMTVIFYFARGRFQNEHNPAAFLNDFFLEDGSNTDL